jgi:hypothetical protein
MINTILLESAWVSCDIGETGAIAHLKDFEIHIMVFKVSGKGVSPHLFTNWPAVPTSTGIGEV